MRTLLLLGWLVLPAGFGVWHSGPGKDRLKLEAAGKLLAKGDHHAAQGEWAEAVESYDQALRLLPAGLAGSTEARAIRLARAKAVLQDGQLDAANASLEALCAELKADAGADPRALEEATSALAQSYFFLTWSMRLDAMPREEWEPKIETARQTYRLLAVQAGEKKDDKAQRKHEEDLEAAVRLARMDDKELRDCSSPSQCRCPSSRKRPGKPGEKKLVKGRSARDARSASAGPPPDTGGH